jgi:molybdopterin-guanine dinucleotide biosynthesis protein A
LTEERPNTNARKGEGPQTENSEGGYPRTEVTGVVLAGGRALRMGGVDKGLVQIGDRPMIWHVLQRLRPQVGQVVVNANRSLDAYAEFGLPIVADRTDEFLGPLSGIAAGMSAATTEFVLAVPCDTPLMPKQLASRLYEACRQGAEIAVAHDGEVYQPLFVMLRRKLLPSLETFLDGGGRKVMHWYTQHSMSSVDFADRKEDFMNVNQADQIADLLQRVASDDGTMP